MQEGNKKKKWGKPKLIILIRGKHEEAVLQGCKAYSSGSGPADHHSGGCYTKVANTYYCTACSLDRSS